MSTLDLNVAPLSLHLLGPMEVRLRGAPLPHLRTRKGAWLLALLALRPGHEAERAWLAGILWPDSPEPQALASLRKSLKDLRRALGPEAGRLRAPTPRSLALDLSGAVVDLLAFDAAIERGRIAERSEVVLASLAEATALYRGPLLDGCGEEWVFPERQAREEAYLLALEALAREALASGDAAAAEHHLRRAAAVDPLRESVQRGLMRVLVAGGSYAAALQVYQELRLRLHRELNAAPDPETIALFQELRAAARDRAVGLWPRVRPLTGRGAEDRDPSPAPMDDLSRLSSTPSPQQSEPLAALNDARLPPSSEPGLITNLPLQLTSFVGRVDEIAAVERLLAGERLVTLTGAGGCGKTRLALQVAGEWTGIVADGVWLVELASLADAALVPRAVAAALGLQELGADGSAPQEQSLTALLTHFLHRRELLLVLDNCEHLVQACAELAEILLRACPRLRILATSREGLGIAGETRFRVPSLALPELQQLPLEADLIQYEAVRLFVERAWLTDTS